MWLRAYGHELGRGDAAAARRALDRAVAALPARKHIKVGDKSYLPTEVPRAENRLKSPTVSEVPRHLCHP